MTALRRYHRRLHAGRSAADHHDVLAARGWGQRSEAQLSSADRILNAGDRISPVKMADAGLIARDACPNVFGRPVRRLVRHFGIADEGPRPAAPVVLTAGAHASARLRLLH